MIPGGGLLIKKARTEIQNINEKATIEMKRGTHHHNYR